MKYGRCATTIEEQVDILENRGLIIEDRSFAISSLRKIGYFRFKGYCLPFYKSKDKFMENVTFLLSIRIIDLTKGFVYYYFK